MYVQLGSTWLTNPNDGTSERVITSSRSLKINGKGLVQEADVLRAVSAALFARNNLSHAISFKVTRRFASIASAFAFAATHRSSLPASGVLTLITGWPSEGQVTLRAANAVLEDCDYDSDDTPGVSITHSYALRCGVITQVSVAPVGGVLIQTESGINLQTEAGENLTT